MDSPLRILQLANEAGPLRLFMLPVCDALRDSGVDVELACKAGGPNFEPLRAAGYPLHALTPGRWNNPFACLRIYREVRSLLMRGRYDLLVVHTPVMSWIARLAARGHVGSVIYMAHGLTFPPYSRKPKYWLLRKIEEYFARNTDGLIVMNRADEISCETYSLTCPEGRWFKVPGVGVDINTWAMPLSESQRGQLDEDFGIALDRPLILYMGRFLKTKGIADIIELARRIGKTADFVLAGEGPLWKRTRKWAETQALNVRVLGWTDRSRDLVRRCALAVFPSVYLEGLPRFVLEAQAAGKPVVAYDVQGAQDIIVSGQTGILVPPGDVEAFCRAAQNLLGDETLRRKMGVAGQQHVRKNFSIKASVDAQLAAFAWMLRQKGIACSWGRSDD